MQFDLIRTLLRCLIAAFLLACGSAQARDIQVSMLAPPAAAATSLSRLITDARGKIHLSWVESRDANSALYYATLEGDTWGQANLIQQGNDWFVNWADFPFLAVTDRGMVAHWLQKTAEGTYDYAINAVFFDQEKHRWGQPITIHKDGVSAEHGFVSMLPLAEGRSFMTWLDGRNTKPATPSEPGTDASGHTMTGGMTLRAAVFDQHGATLEDWELDSLTCDCCNTSSAMSAADPVVVYRDRTEKEIRDIYITRLVDGHWTKPTAVSADHWEVPGCPVNGPAVAAQGHLTAVVWFTAKDDQPKVQLAISQDDGESFGPPVLVDQGATNGRVSMAILESGAIAISWLHTNGKDAALKLALYSPKGDLLAETTVAATKSSRRSGFPVIASRGDDVYVTWTDITADTQVKVARVRYKWGQDQVPVRTDEDEAGFLRAGD
jgi:hypothetical protein